MDQDRYTIPSATGVDVELAIAGAGSRSYAFLIDWHIRILLTIAWFVCAAVITGGVHLFTAPPGRSSIGFMLGAVMPAAIIYFLYHPVLEVLMHGRTPGKRTAGVHIVTRGGGTPSAGALLVRNLFRLIDSAPAFYMLGLFTCLFTAQRVRIGDMAAGTLLVFDHGASVGSLAQLGALSSTSKLDPATLDVIAELLSRWSDLTAQPRAALARALLQRVDAGQDVAQLAALSSQELRERLQRLLRGREN